MTETMIYLASQSARRRSLLQQLGVRFQILPSDIDETLLAKETVTESVTRLALQKARAGWRQPRRTIDIPVLAADTLVACAGVTMGKPRDAEDAQAMLQRLSGTTHEVLTAVAMVQGAQEQVYCSRSSVTFRQLSAEEIHGYWQTGEPKDKAGAYAIQGLAGFWIQEIRGSYSGIVGLPLFELGLLFADFGFSFTDLAQTLVTLE